MRIVFATDLHDNPAAPAWVEKMAKSHDLCLLGGDFGFNVIEDIIDVIKQHDNIYACLGNHDWPIWQHPQILHGTKAQFNGYTIGGIGGSLPVSGHWPFELDDTEYLVITKNMELEPKVDILISHQPPYMTPLDITWDKRHVGSASIAKFIEETQMILSLHGHIHESSAIGKIGKTIIANPGSYAEGRYLEVDIVGREVTRAKVFYDKSLEWPSAAELLQQSRQRRWSLSDLEPSLTRSRKA